MADSSARAWIWAIALAVGAGTLACTAAETSTSLTGPSASKCQVQISGSPAAFPADGGSGTLTIDTTRDCSWSAVSGASWVSVGKAEGQGGGSVPFTVNANALASPRTAAITVGGDAFQLSQDAAPCRYTLNPDDAPIGYQGAEFAVEVETLAGCRWSAASDAAWLTVVRGSSGQASGTMRVAAAPNDGGARTGHVTIADGAALVVREAGPPPPEPPAPPPGSPAPPPPPTPAPSPPPPSPGGTAVHLSGRVKSVSGACPGVRFTLDHVAPEIVAGAATAYSGGQCADVARDQQLTVDGTTQADGTVAADVITIEQKHHGH
jgi:hypothetical protein